MLDAPTKEAPAPLRRAASGFAIAVALGVPLGLSIGWYRTLADILNPLLELFRNTAPLLVERRLTAWRGDR